MDNFQNTQVIPQGNYQQTQISPTTQTTLTNNTTLQNTQQIDISTIPKGEVFQGKVLGSGGFGIIYAGSWKSFQVAIKILRAKDQHLQQEFMNESKIMAGLKHARIVRFFGIGKNPLMMIMELMPRGDLSNLLSNPKQQIPWEPLRWQWALDIGAGITYLHNQNIVHRDLKSQNVLLDANLRAKLADFGLSLRKTTSEMVIHKGAGSIPWMAPELFNKQIKITAASDVYAYGMILWEISSRKFPFSDALNQDIIPRWIQDGEREKIPADCPKAVVNLINTCWAADPQARPSAAAALQALKQAKPTSMPNLPENEESAFSKIVEILKVLVTFTGRKNHLAALKKSLVDDWQPKGLTRIQALTGLGGVGKSEIACQFANQFISQFDLIYWIPSETQLQRENAFRDLAAKLGIYLDKEDKYPTIRSKVYGDLESRSFQRPYLLVFDNLEEKEVFPSGASVLITAQNGQIYNPQQVVPVKPFTAEEAIELVQTITRDTDLQSIKTLVQALGNFPLAIDKACAYISKEKFTVSKYLQNLDVQALLQESGTNRHKLSLLATWQLTLKVLDPLAVEWLTLCAYLAPDNIPSIWMSSWLQKLKQDPGKKQTIMSSLRSYGLIDHAQTQELFSTHRLLQEILRTPEPDQSRHQALVLLSEIGNKFDEKEIETWDSGHIFLSHSKALVQQKGSFQSSQNRLAALLGKMGEVEFNLANYSSALDDYQQALAITEKLHGDKHPDVPGLLNHIGGTLDELGRLKEALVSYKRALTISGEVQNTNPSDSASYLNNIGTVLCDMGRLEEAFRYHQESLAIRRKLYQENDPDIANSLNNIGTVFFKKEDYKQALDYYKQALNMRKKLHGDEHPFVANAMNNCGSALGKLEMHKEALFHLQTALEIYRKIYGDRHSTTASALANIGQVLNKIGQYDEALILHQKTLEVRQKIYENNHIGIANTLNAIGDTLTNLKKHNLAIKFYSQGIEIYINNYGSKHPYVAALLNTLGNHLQAQGQHDKALYYCKQALDILNENEEENRSDIMHLLQNVGTILYNQGHYGEAHNYYIQALKALKKLNKIDRPTIATLLKSIGNALYQQKQYREALKYYDQVLVLHNEIYGTSHSYTETSKEVVEAVKTKIQETQPPQIQMSQSIKTSQKMEKTTKKGCNIQ